MSRGIRDLQEPDVFEDLLNKLVEAKPGYRRVFNIEGQAEIRFSRVAHNINVRIVENDGRTLLYESLADQLDSLLDGSGHTVQWAKGDFYAYDKVMARAIKLLDYYMDYPYAINPWYEGHTNNPVY